MKPHNPSRFLRKPRLILRKLWNKTWLRNTILFGLGSFIFLVGALLIWVSTFALPDLDSFERRQVSESTKIFDKTGKVLLYDVHQEIRRTIVPFDQIAQDVKDATIAIEDAEFYNHIGVRPLAVARAFWINVSQGGFKQGGSTITQQVVKNALLSPEKTITRKVKEWVLAIRLEQLLTKDEILSIYLNEVPYGGPIYGIQEAASFFFGKEAKDLTLTESAYLAALPQAPSYFSPYGNNREKLEERKNLVLAAMKSHSLITEDEYEAAKNERIEFRRQDSFGIKAPHFVFYIKQLLEKEYGEEVIQTGGLKVITTLDYELQKEAEEIVNKYALENEKNFGAENASLVAVDPQTGQILVMVGSRDYFDKKIDGNYNVATALRQPGSTFKPFAYAAAFAKGYRPETTVFDLETEFSTACSSGGSCYNPGNFDGLFRGPMTLRNALAQSINIPAVKVLYLAGPENVLRLAKNMGISSLGESKRYGLSLVLGGAEVSPLEMANAYGVFATGGYLHPHTGILRIEDKEGNVLAEFKDESKRVLDKQVADQISSILSDNNARTPIFGPRSSLYFEDTDVAAKTGTTNDYRDGWVVGYTPHIAVATWAGNNDNRPMPARQLAGLVAAPMWRAFMDTALEVIPSTNFDDPSPQDQNVKPVIRGQIIEPVHEILHWVDKENPLGDIPPNPSSDPAYYLWEAPVARWAGAQGLQTDGVIPISTTDSGPFKLQITSPAANVTLPKNKAFTISISSDTSLVSADVFVNEVNIGAIDLGTKSLTFIPNLFGKIEPENTLTVRAKNEAGDVVEKTVFFAVE